MYGNFTAAGPYRSLWPEVTTFLSQGDEHSGSEAAIFPCLTLQIIGLYLTLWNFAARGSQSSLCPEVTAFLSHRGIYSWSEAVTVACGHGPKDFISPKSLFPPEQMVSKCKFLLSF